MYGTNTVLIH